MNLALAGESIRFHRLRAQSYTAALPPLGSQLQGWDLTAYTWEISTSLGSITLLEPLTEPRKHLLTVTSFSSQMKRGVGPVFHKAASVLVELGARLGGTRERSSFSSMKLSVKGPKRPLLGFLWRFRYIVMTNSLAIG